MSSGSKTALEWRHLPAVSKTFFFEKMYTSSCAPLSALKLHFYLVSGHICIKNMINLVSVYHFHSQN